MTAPELDRATSEIELEIHAQLGAAIITLRGEHDLTTQPRLIQALTQAGEYDIVLVDLSVCTFMDSTVINALIATHNGLSQRQGHLEIVIPPEASAARRVVELNCLAEIMTVHSGRNGRAPQAGGEAA